MSLHLVVGCMFSGKSTELLRRAAEARDAGRRVLIVTHSCDTRYGERCVASHDGVKAPASAVDRIGDVLQLPGYAAAECVFIEEGQFFDPTELRDFVLTAVEVHGKVLTVCGLDGDYMRRPFDGVLGLVPLSNTVMRTTRARCSDCSAPALFSRRRIRAARDVLLVGGAETYAPACRACWRAPPEDGEH